LAANEAKAYEGLVSIYAICEAIRTWLIDYNDTDETYAHTNYNSTIGMTGNRSDTTTHDQSSNSTILRHLYLGLKASCPHITFSRLNSTLGGSYHVISQSVICGRSAWIVQWSTTPDSSKDDDAQDKELLLPWHSPVTAIPIINCTEHKNKVLMELANSTIQDMFDSSHHQHVDMQQMQDPVQQFEKLSLFLESAREEMITLLSDKLEKLTLSTRSCRRTTNSIRSKQKEAALQLSPLLNDFSKIISYSTLSSNSTLKALPNSYDQQQSFDYIDIYQEAEKMEMDWIKEAEKKLSAEMVHGSFVNTNNSKFSNVCEICFDEFTGDEIGLSLCNHTFCRMCWRGLLQSAASSGEAVIHCPCFRCPNVVGIRDIAHILFNSHKFTAVSSGSLPDDSKDKESGIEQKPLMGSDKQDTNILMKLMQARMERYLVDNQSSKKGTVFRFCSNACCRKILHLPEKKEEDEAATHKKKVDENTSLGSYILMCNCGTGICSKCHQNAHYGISCEENLKIRVQIAGGDLEGEISTLHFLKTFTSPCPKCSFPIMKDGGCNHMRCTKCNYYFCWVCGGEGNKCNAYQCKNAKITADVSDRNAIHRGLITQTPYNLNLPEVQYAIRDYSRADWELKSAIRKQAALSGDETVLLEVLLHQMILFAQAFIMYETVYKDNRLSVTKVIDMVKKMYFALDALRIRVQRKKQDDLISEQRLIKSETLGAEHSAYLHQELLPKKKTTSKRQEQKLQAYETKRATKAFVKRKEQANPSFFPPGEKQLKEQEKKNDMLSSLYNINKKRFRNEILSVMNQVAQSIVAVKRNS